jgi:hypothetical protein
MKCCHGYVRIDDRLPYLYLVPHEVISSKDWNKSMIQSIIDKNMNSKWFSSIFIVTTSSWPGYRGDRISQKVLGQTLSSHDEPLLEKLIWRVMMIRWTLTEIRSFSRSLRRCPNEASSWFISMRFVLAETTRRRIAWFTRVGPEFPPRNAKFANLVRSHESELDPFLKSDKSQWKMDTGSHQLKERNDGRWDAYRACEKLEQSRMNHAHVLKHSIGWHHYLPILHGVSQSLWREVANRWIWKNRVAEGSTENWIHLNRVFMHQAILNSVYLWTGVFGPTLWLENPRSSVMIPMRPKII